MSSKEKIAVKSKLYWTNILLFALVYLCFSYVILQKPIQVSGTDFWMHSGHVAIFSKNLVNPVSNYDEPEIIRSRNFSPYQFGLALIARMSGISTIDVMALGGLIGTLILFYGIWNLASVFGDSPWLPGILLLALLFFLGYGFGWSGEINAAKIPRSSAYPSFFATGLTFICWYQAEKFLVWRNSLSLFYVSVLVALVFLIHQLIFCYLLLFIGIWSAFHDCKPHLKALLLGAVLFGVLGSLLWPYFNPAEVAWTAAVGGKESGGSRPDNIFFTDSAREVFAQQRQQFTDPAAIFRSIGPAIVALPLLPFLPPRLRLRLTLIVLGTLYLWFSRYVGLPKLPTSGYRWAMATLIALQLVIGISLAQSVTKAYLGSVKSTVYAALLLLLLVGTLHFQAKNLYYKFGEFVLPIGSAKLSDARRWEVFSTQVKEFEPGVIVAEKYHSYVMPTFDLSPVVFSRKSNPDVDKLIKLYSEKMALDERQILLLDFDTTYYIVEPDSLDTAVAEQLAKLGVEVLSASGLSLYRITR
jgi:hypothetical protein